MDRNQKEHSVTELNSLFSESGAVIVAQYSGLSVAQMNDLRTRMREAGASFKVAKNRLAKRALEGTPVAGISDLFTGPTGIGYSEDPVAAPKVLVTFAKENESLVILGGAAVSRRAPRQNCWAFTSTCDENRWCIAGSSRAIGPGSLRVREKSSVKVLAILNSNPI